MICSTIVFLLKMIEIQMTAKKSKKQKPAGKLAAEKPTQQLSETAYNESVQKMDFGGLPERDLKKNLGGCG
jgi:hypothetical protein